MKCYHCDPPPSLTSQLKQDKVRRNENKLMKQEDITYIFILKAVYTQGVNETYRNTGAVSTKDQMDSALWIQLHNMNFKRGLQGATDKGMKCLYTVEKDSSLSKFGWRILTCCCQKRFSRRAQEESFFTVTSVKTGHNVLLNTICVLSVKRLNIG